MKTITGVHTYTQETTTQKWMRGKGRSIFTDTRAIRLNSPPLPSAIQLEQQPKDWRQK
ncbi:MAG: hypothetical protein IPH36_05795 [Saprospiraceae bacterium]|nr:hypothetical protein [Saprospiraceae bacterium]